MIEIKKLLQRTCILFVCMSICLNVSAQSVRLISGTVVDATGEPAIGASVVVKGTTIGTATDIDGNFQLNNVADNAVLIISYIGYVTQEMLGENFYRWLYTAVTRATHRLFFINLPEAFEQLGV